jgi:hypothetical protein
MKKQKPKTRVVNNNYLDDMSTKTSILDLLALLQRPNLLKKKLQLKAQPPCISKIFFSRINDSAS